MRAFIFSDFFILACLSHASNTFHHCVTALLSCVTNNNMCTVPRTGAIQYSLYILKIQMVVCLNTILLPILLYSFECLNKNAMTFLIIFSLIQKKNENQNNERSLLKILRKNEDTTAVEKELAFGEHKNTRKFRMWYT